MDQEQQYFVPLRRRTLAEAVTYVAKAIDAGDLPPEAVSIVLMGLVDTYSEEYPESQSSFYEV